PYGELVYRLGTTSTPFLYNGRDGVMSDSNGLYYMRARYYNPEILRFINQDVLLGNVSSSQTLNRYAYVNGEPVSFVDPFGLERGPLTQGLINSDYWLNGWAKGLLNGIYHTSPIPYMLGGFKDTYHMVTNPSGYNDEKMQQWNTISHPIVALNSAYNRFCSLKQEEKFGVVGQVGGNLFGPAAAVKFAAMARPAEGAGNLGGEMTTVGRWMSPSELEAMQETGMVQESYSGTTHVVHPADASGFGKQAAPGSVYVEFDVPVTAVKPTSSGGVAKIVGPNSLEGRLAANKGLPVPQMPAAQNIIVKGLK
ncbi:MAG: RHS repeat-associated core domain-containing protein, partial [Acidobacteriota bacterium]